jgi:hypothetical protein
MPRLPDVVEVTVTASGQPVGGLMVRVGIGVTKKNGFRSFHGPSTPDGRILVTRDALLREAERTLSLGLMDHGNPEADGSGELFVIPADRDDIARALEGYERTRKFTGFPPGYSEALAQTAETLRRLGSVRIDAAVKSVGGEVDVQGGYTRL